jgi:hypothetical protein
MKRERTRRRPCDCVCMCACVCGLPPSQFRKCDNPGVYMSGIKDAYCNGKDRPRTGHEGPEEEWRCSYTLSLTSAIDGWVVNATLRPLYPRERPGTHCIGGWVGPRAGLDGCGKSRLPRVWSLDGPACNESLYRLSHPAPRRLMQGPEFIVIIWASKCIGTFPSNRIEPTWRLRVIVI